ncbi:MAG: hypothetical protein IJ386_03475 [Clostridia bacterium]|nr:hypothetical protein [Clostridia bacterium]
MMRRFVNNIDTDNPVIRIIVSILSIFIGCIFIFQYRDYIPISRDDAQEYTGEFDHYEIVELGRRGRTEYLDIHMDDGTVLRLHHTCNYTDVTDALDRLESDDNITVLVNPASDYVIEIISEDTEILNIDEAQNRMRNEAIVFVILGAVMICIALLLTSVSVYDTVRGKRKKGKRKNERNKK